MSECYATADGRWTAERMDLTCVSPPRDARMISPQDGDGEYLLLRLGSNAIRFVAMERTHRAIIGGVRKVKTLRTDDDAFTECAGIAGSPLERVPCQPGRWALALAA